MWRVFTLRPFKLDCNSTALLPTAIAPPANLILSKVAMPAFKLCRHRGPSPATIAAWALLISSFSAAVSSAAEVDAAKLPPAADRKVDFAHDIQPLLTQRCEKCHGPKKQESGLRLDDKQAALRGGEAGYGPTIVTGKSAESVLIHAVAGARDDLARMPPDEEPLSAAQIGLLRAWIDQGATWPDTAPVASTKSRDHWAFKPPARTALPSVPNSTWPKNAIDNFIAAKLDAVGLKASAEADRVTVLRRLSLDLIGLPPTIAEVDAFLADESPDAYEKQVARLLASPHYGERWGRHWLDAARYADSDGYEKDKSRQVYFYRDWVIGALNRDLPYDQFLLEQLAGDLLPNPTQDQLVATGFLRNSMLNEEGGVDPEQFRMDAMFDRMDAIGKSVLGLTIQCAQCHSHKFDPLTQEEYYRLFAYLNNDDEPQQVAYAPAELLKCEAITRRIRELEEELRHRTPDWQARLSTWEEATREAERGADWRILHADEYVDVGGGAKLSRLPDESLLCAGYAPTHCTFRVVAKTDLPEVTAIRLEMLTHPNLPAGGPGRSFKGTFGLTEIRLEAAPADTPDKKTAVKLVAATADYSQPERPLEAQLDDRSGKKKVVGGVNYAIDGKDETAWGIDAGPGRRNQDRVAVFVLEQPINAPAGSVLTFSIIQNHGGWNSDDHQNNLLGCFRLSVTGQKEPAARVPVARRTREILEHPAVERSPAQRESLFSHWRTQVAEWNDANEQIETLWREWPEGSTALVLASRSELRPTKMLVRGDFLRPGNDVSAGVPSFLHPVPEGAPATRMTLARWLTDRSSPTRARVFVNRIWQAYFGTGLVSTSEDFGTQCEAPSHPELLDWLACEFMDNGWSVKHIHRLIVTSATYRQSSKLTPELIERDPQNRLLARGARFRVEGEIVRDIALAASGLLNPEFGGPSVFPPIPESVLSFSYGPMTWNAETGPNRYRRALYTFRRRSIPFPALQNFDVPNGDFACVRRTRSNTPLQALTTLNEILFVESAQALARRTWSEGGRSDEERLNYAFRRCVSRQPSEAEIAELRGLLDRSRRHLAEGWTNIIELATGKPALDGELPAGATPTDLASYTLVARVLLNLDETYTKE